MICENLAKNIKLCYTYDDLSRVIKRETISPANGETVVDTENFNYNPAGNMTIGMDESVVYDANNRIVEYRGTEVTYDADGNMLVSPVGEFTYDWANRLITADTYSYVYDVENIRTKKCVGETITEYTHNANSKLSQLLMKTENGVTTYYVYGRGLIGEEVDGAFKTYHYDYRGSTVAITDESGTKTDTFEYDTYGRLSSRTGTTNTQFLYNGRDGVMSDENGLVYMRARYYSPELKRFINADVVAGSITNAITLNRYAYANGNPVSNVDPFGLEAVLDEYMGTNYCGVKNITLIIDQPIINLRTAAVVQNGKLNNGHSFIRLDDGNGNVQYVGFAPESNGVLEMMFSLDVKGKIVDDSNTNWDVAKVYTLSDEQYEYMRKFVETVKVISPVYNIQTYNCTTFAVHAVKMATNAEDIFVDVSEHDWTLPYNVARMLPAYDAYPDWLPEGFEYVVAVAIENTMGNFYGYTPADAAEDLKGSEGTVLVKQGDSIRCK